MRNLPKIMQRAYRRLTTPDKIQTFINNIPANFELKGETYLSPLRVLQTNKAHCMEGAMLAASILRYHGQKPLLMDLRVKKPDQDHVVTLFKVGKYWGAISKTNHAVLRYREPIYRTLRELALSYFHEYFDNKTGRKNLREYSVPLNLSRFDAINWETTNEDLWDIVDAVDNARHYVLITARQGKFLRRAEGIEIKAGEITEWSKSGKFLIQKSAHK
jgi:hypothetical protein